MSITELDNALQDIYLLIEKRISDITDQSHKKHQHRSNEIHELSSALSKAQGEFKIAGKRSENPFFKSRYADLEEVVSASRPALSKHGLSVMQQIMINEDGSSTLHTILSHASGQWIESIMKIVPPKNDPQSLGSTITYMRRYSYASLIGVVVSDEDDDAEIAMVNARQIMAKGPSTKYNPKDQSPEFISREQLEELEYELADMPDLAEDILEKMRISSLADLPKNKFMISIQRIREIKQIRNGK